MGKGDKIIAKKEAFQRINYLYQAAHQVLKSNPSNAELVKFYIKDLKSVAKKQVLRIDPTIKRCLCKKCHMLLVPGISSTVRHRSKPQPHQVTTCLECKTVKIFVTNGAYKLWSDQPEAWVVGGPHKNKTIPASKEADCQPHIIYESKDTSQIKKCQEVNGGNIFSQTSTTKVGSSQTQINLNSGKDVNLNESANDTVTVCQYPDKMNRVGKDCVPCDKVKKDDAKKLELCCSCTNLHTTNDANHTIKLSKTQVIESNVT